MKRVLLAALLAAGPAMSGTLVARQGDDWVRMFDLPCKNQLVLARIEERAQDRFRQASSRFGGKHYAACWIQMGNAYYLVYEDGDQGVIPANEAKEELGV